MMYGLAAGGLVLLCLGGEILVRGAVALARRLRISDLLIGLTVVGFGTSAPELVVSLEAVLDGRPDIAVGAVVGSNIANVALVLGVAALITPIRCAPAVVTRDGAAMLVASAVLVALALTGVIERWEGGLMLAVLLGFIGYSYWSETRAKAPSATLHAHEVEEFSDVSMTLWVSLAALAGGLACVIIGSKMLIVGAVSIAREAGMSEAVIGLTLVAVGTSLPELATGVVAALRRHTDVAIGNVLGSNIFNIMGMLGVTAIVTPVPIAAQIAGFDVWVMLAVAAVLIPFLVTGWRLDRIEAAAFLALYAAYTAALFFDLPQWLAASALG